MKIKNKISIFSVSFLILGISVITLLIFIQSEKAIGTRVDDHLASISILKENQLKTYFDNQIENIEELTNNNVFIESVDDYFNGNNIDNDVRLLLNEKLLNKNNFIELFILNLDGRVDISTDLDNEGIFRNQEKYFNEGKEKTYIQNFFYDIAIQAPSVLISTPIKKSNDDLLGVLAARVNLDELSQIMLETSGLGETGETYLVNKFNFLVTDSRFQKGLALIKVISDSYINDCLEHNNGHIHINDYRGVFSIINYNWIPEIEVCMIVSLSKEEAFASVQNLKNTVIIMIIIVIVLAIFVSLFLSQTLTKSISKLISASREIGIGNLPTNIDIKTKDEMGELAVSFKKMIIDLSTLHKKLNKYNFQLEKKVKERTKELEQKNLQLERFNKLAVGRELKMIDLKKKVREQQKDEEN